MNPTAHMTTGTERRAAHQLSGGGLVFRLGEEIEELRRDLRSSSGHRSAKTLAKAGSLRVTLVVLEANAALEPEASGGGATGSLFAAYKRPCPSSAKPAGKSFAFVATVRSRLSVPSAAMLSTAIMSCAPCAAAGRL